MIADALFPSVVTVKLSKGVKRFTFTHCGLQSFVLRDANATVLNKRVLGRSRLVVAPPVLSLRCFFATSASSKIGVKPTVTSSYDDVPKETLRFITAEAERLLRLCSASHDNEKDMSEENVTAALDAASALLIVSRPSAALTDAILHHSLPSSQIASLHKAFLCVTSWCLDVAAHDDPHIRNAILDRTLVLARRAHELTLPFHLPLNRRIMLTVAGLAEDSVPETILQVSNWIRTCLDAPIDAALFRPSVCALIRRRRIHEALDLLEGMQKQHACSIDSATSAEILLTLRSVIVDSMKNPRVSIPQREVEQVMGRLEATRHHSPDSPYGVNFNGPERAQASLHDYPTLHQTASAQQWETSHTTENQQPKPVAHESMLPAIFSLFSLLKLTGRETEADDAIGSDDTVDSDKSEPDSEMTDLLYTRDGLYEFPDVTSQIARLNGGRKLRFTKEYENTMWLREYDEEMVDGYYSTGSGSNSDDDYDDDDDGEGDL